MTELKESYKKVGIQAGIMGCLFALSLAAMIILIIPLLGYAIDEFVIAYSSDGSDDPDKLVDETHKSIHDVGSKAFALYLSATGIILVGCIALAVTALLYWMKLVSRISFAIAVVAIIGACALCFSAGSLLVSEANKLVAEKPVQTPAQRISDDPEPVDPTTPEIEFAVIETMYRSFGWMGNVVGISCVLLTIGVILAFFRN